MQELYDERKELNNKLRSLNHKIREMEMEESCTEIELNVGDVVSVQGKRGKFIGIFIGGWPHRVTVKLEPTR